MNAASEETSSEHYTAFLSLNHHCSQRYNLAPAFVFSPNLQQSPIRAWGPERREGGACQKDRGGQGWENDESRRSAGSQALFPSSIYGFLLVKALPSPEQPHETPMNGQCDAAASAKPRSNGYKQGRSHPPVNDTKCQSYHSQRVYSGFRRRRRYPSARSVLVTLWGLKWLRATTKYGLATRKIYVAIPSA